MRTLTATLVMTMCLSNAYAAEKMELKPLNDKEVWWDGVVRNALKVPYVGNSDKRPYKMMHNSRANQTSPIMISNQGRWVWSDGPFAFQVKDGALVIESQTKSEILHGKAGTTLRDAYLYLSKTYFPPSGKTVDLRIKPLDEEAWLVGIVTFLNRSVDL